MIITGILTVFNLIGIFHSLTVLILGLVLPLYCIQIDISIPKYYFHVLSILLWFRLWSTTLSSVDVKICQILGLFDNRTLAY